MEPESGGARKERRRRSFWREFPVLVVVAVTLAVLIKTFAAQAFFIPSGSMENTLNVDDRILVNKVVYRLRDVERGDTIVFKGPASWRPAQADPPGGILRSVRGALGFAPAETDFIKRVIGVAGDRVKCCDAEGRVTVNGVPLDERSYLYRDPVTHERDKPSTETFDIVVPPGRLWVMGDHRGNSADSRYHRRGSDDGTIPVRNVIGRASVILWPVGHATTLPTPGTFHQRALDTGP
ncbi:signal peptidase I [Actinomadura flavalba]|uniref:signal peptidase I n=1 Tax=Actinomadura flavalba TaxID=1120938 RepID=UPI00039CD6EF|nr:signal peptidase I [Actinomadura flavalba]